MISLAFAIVVRGSATATTITSTITVAIVNLIVLDELELSLKFSVLANQLLELSFQLADDLHTLSRLLLLLLERDVELGQQWPHRHQTVIRHNKFAFWVLRDAGGGGCNWLCATTRSSRTAAAAVAGGGISIDGVGNRVIIFSRIVCGSVRV